MLPACDAAALGAKPTIRLWLDAPVSDVVAGSTYPFTDDFKSGGAAGGMITTPHVLVIDEPGFALRFEDAGGLPSLPTTIGHSYRHDASDPPSRVKYFGVHPLPDYVQLRAALAKARELLKDLRTSYETSNTGAVLDGDLDSFMQAELERLATGSPPTADDDPPAAGGNEPG